MAKVEQDWSDNEPGPERYIPTNERGVITYPYIYSHATKATELAIQAIDKTEKTWQEQVPLEYHFYSKVFSDKEASRFPQSRPWDHAIELLPDAPQTLNCKIYSLSSKEQETLDEFLEEHLKKRYIRRSNSPYASPFFFVNKKDGKLHSVQDYCRLNEWTV